MVRFGLILVLFIGGMIAISTGSLQLSARGGPAWFMIDGLWARVVGGVTIAGALWLLSREFRGDSRSRPKKSKEILNEYRDDVHPPPVSHPPELTENERQFLELLSEGLSDDEIANRLGLLDFQVNMMTLQLAGRFEVKNKAELIERAKEMGVL